MSVTRRWYAYNGASGGQHNQLNYFFIANFPNACLTSANNICAVRGIYSENPGSGTVTYGTNPKSFTSDPRLDSYITDAFAAGTPAPTLAGTRKYVYVRQFI